MSKKLWIILVIAILAVVAAAFYASMNKTKPLEVQTTELDAVEIPSGFLADLPVETGSKILENYEATTEDGRKQSTRVATTLKTLEEGMQTFRKYFSEKGWTEIETQVVNANVRTTLMKKGDNTLMISGRNNQTTQEKTISLTLTEFAQRAE